MGKLPDPVKLQSVWCAVMRWRLQYGTLPRNRTDRDARVPRESAHRHQVYSVWAGVQASPSSLTLYTVIYKHKADAEMEVGTLDATTQRTDRLTHRQARDQAAQHARHLGHTVLYYELHS